MLMVQKEEPFIKSSKIQINNAYNNKEHRLRGCIVLKKTFCTFEKLVTFIFFGCLGDDLQSFCLDPGFDSVSTSISSSANSMKLRLSPWSFNLIKMRKQSICLSLTDFTQRTLNVTYSNIAKKAYNSNGKNKN